MLQPRPCGCSASLASALLLILGLVCVDAAYSLGSSPNGDLAVNAAPGYASTWAPMNANIMPGFCFNESEGRVLQHYSQPLYSKVITMDGLLFVPGYPLMWGWVVKILLQEMVSITS